MLLLGFYLNVYNLINKFCPGRIFPDRAAILIPLASVCGHLRQGGNRLVIYPLIPGIVNGPIEYYFFCWLTVVASLNFRTDPAAVNTELKNPCKIKGRGYIGYCSFLFRREEHTGRLAAL